MPVPGVRFARRALVAATEREELMRPEPARPERVRSAGERSLPWALARAALCAQALPAWRA